MDVDNELDEHGTREPDDMDETKLRQLERHYKLRVKTGCETCRCVNEPFFVFDSSRYVS
jgi:hypothetical protein